MDPTFAHESFHMPCAQWVGDIPADACQNNILWKIGPLKAHGHRLSPLWVHPESQGEIIPQMASNENCDRTLMLPGSTMTHGNRIYKATDCCRCRYGGGPAVLCGRDR